LAACARNLLCPETRLDPLPNSGGTRLAQTAARTTDGRDALLGSIESQRSVAAHSTAEANGIVERFHRTVLNEFYRVAFRREIYSTIEQLQGDLDNWLREYNELRPHQGRWCYGKMPRQTLADSLPLAREKLLPGADLRNEPDDDDWLRRAAVVTTTA